MDEAKDSLLEDVKTEGYNEAVDDSAKEMKSIKDQVYRGGYEFALTCAGLAPDHELFERTVLCPPNIFAAPPPSESDDEIDEEGEQETVGAISAKGDAGGASSNFQVVIPPLSESNEVIDEGGEQETVGAISAEGDAGGTSLGVQVVIPPPSGTSSSPPTVEPTSSAPTVVLPPPNS